MQSAAGFGPERIARDALTSCATALIPGAYATGLTEHEPTPIAPLKHTVAAYPG
jgi:hypothetical protein